MWPARYFNPRYWASRYWPKVGADPQVVGLPATELHGAYRPVVQLAGRSGGVELGGVHVGSIELEGKWS